MGQKPDKEEKGEAVISGAASTLSFSKALELLKTGSKIARFGWHGKRTN